MTRPTSQIATAVRLLCLAACLAVTAASKYYSDGEVVDLYANVVGPFANPSETYQYFTLPLCAPRPESHEKLLGLGEVLAGHRLRSGPYVIKFKQPVESATLCTRHYSVEDLQTLRHAVIADYYFQLLMDGDLPLWGFIGKMERVKPETKDQDAHKLVLFTHLHFDILYNGDRVIQVDISTNPEAAIDISKPTAGTIEYTYSVSWQPTDIPFGRRKERYEKYSFLPQHVELHWFSIINSCATVVVLTGVLASILLRVLRADVRRYMDPESAENREAGWKTLHGDVFRPPPAPGVFAACVGAGTQILVVALAIFLLAIAGHYRAYNRGAMLASCVILYALTAGVAGYTSGRLFRALGGEEWAGNCAFVMLLFCGPLLVNFSVLNSIAWAYGSTAALPFGTIVIIFLLWLVVTAPLTVAGAAMGRRGPGDLDAPCRTSKHVRDVPELPWHRGAFAQMLAAGLLPFSAIYIELHYIFASVWGHKVYTIYTVLFIIFCVLLVVTAFVTIALTYFQLAAEDHRWWWRSFLCGGATGLYIYAYALYFFYARSNMGGLMQTSFYFGYNFVMCYAVFLMLGAVGWAASLAFVKYMFRSIKSD